MFIQKKKLRKINKYAIVRAQSNICDLLDGLAMVKKKHFHPLFIFIIYCYVVASTDLFVCVLKWKIVTFIATF